MPQKRTGAVRRRQPRNKKTLSAVISAVLVLAAVLVYYFPELETYLTGAPNTDSSAPAQPTQSTDAADCAVYFLDVGQGDSILIQIGTDYNMLIDAGTREAGETIESDLQALGVTSLHAPARRPHRLHEADYRGLHHRHVLHAPFARRPNAHHRYIRKYA